MPKSSPRHTWGGVALCPPSALAVSRRGWKGRVPVPRGAVSLLSLLNGLLISEVSLLSLSQRPHCPSETSLPLAFLQGDNAISVASVLNEGCFCFPLRLNLRTGSASFC